MRRMVIHLGLAASVACRATSPAPSQAAPTPAGSAPAGSAPAGSAPAGSAPAASPADPASLLGVWRGTSTCTVRPSSCNDEVVVYHVSAGAAPDQLAVQASRIADGQELDMGTLTCDLDRGARRLTCKIARGTFGFAIDGDRIHGTLELTDGSRFRVIELEHTVR